MKKEIKRLLPQEIIEVVLWLKRGAQWLTRFSLDILDVILGQQDELTPPRRMTSYVGDGDFKAIGNAYLKIFIDICDLKPNARVLDVGCGIGRMAIPLTKYLNKDGSYEGFDIVSMGINWLKENISLKYPNFRFQLANVFNKQYNPKGQYEGHTYNFPFENESFNFVFATSVFTHMLPQDVKNYISEISRVLKRGGKCLMTFIILNSESLELIENGISRLDFPYLYGEYRTMDENIPERLVAYDESFIQSLSVKYGLSIEDPILYGSWCGRQNSFRYQDIVILSKI